MSVDDAVVIAHAQTLAVDLLGQLDEVIGDPAGIEAHLARWTQTLGVPRMSMVLLEAVRATYAEFLFHPDDGQPVAVEHRLPEEDR